MRSSIRHFFRDFNQWSLFTMAIGVFIAIPLFAILVYLPSGAGQMWEHIVTHFLFDYIKNSAYLLLGTGLLCFGFGVSSAWIVSRYEFRFRKWIEWALFLPLTIPSYIVAYAYVGLLGNGGTAIRCLQAIGIPIQKVEVMNIQGLIWVLSCSLFPYVYASTRAMFLSMPSDFRDTSNLLGVSRFRYFFSVALPLAFPAISGGLFLVFMEVLNDYGAAKYYGVQTFTTGIFRSWTMLEDLQSAVYLSAILIVLVFVVNTLVNWRKKGKSYAFKESAGQVQATWRKSIKGRERVLCWCLLLLPFVFGFLLPVIQLIYWAVLTFESMFTPDLLWVALESIGIALATTFFVVITALALIYFSNWNHLKGIHLFKKLATIGYVIPGAIIGIGIIRSSQGIINFFDASFQLKIGFLFYGSSIILIYAYVFRFLAVAFNPLQANSLKLGQHLSESAYLLGKNKFKTLVQVELPLLKAALSSTVLIVMIDVLKELPLTLILKPYNVRTLAVKAYEYADDERVAEAALPALILIAMIVVIMAFTNFFNKKPTTTAV